MPGKNHPTMSCADCSKPIFRGTGSRPHGEARCRPCYFAYKGSNLKHNASGYSRGCRCEICKEAAYARNRVAYQSKHDRNHTCVICLTSYLAASHGQRACSPTCNQQRILRNQASRRARKSTASVVPVIPAQIFERDRWRCHICRKKLTRVHSWPHPRYPTLDHLVPLSRGGMHEPANVRACCSQCNSAKGNRGGNEQLLLIG